MQCISPELIIIRVAFGRAFSNETAQTISNVRFRATTRDQANVYTVTDSAVMDQISSRGGHNTFPWGSGDMQESASGTRSHVGSAVEMKLEEVEKYLQHRQ